MLQGFRWEKHSANAAFPSLFVLLGHEGEQLSRNYHLSAPLSPDAPEGKKKDSCQEVSALKNARDAQGGAAGWRCVLTAEETRTQPTEHCSRLSFNAFCPVIKKLHRLQLNTENMIHPVSKLRPLHPSRPKRAAEAEARRSLQGGLCEAPSLPGLSPFFLNTGDRTLFVLRRHGGGGSFELWEWPEALPVSCQSHRVSFPVVPLGPSSSSALPAITCQCQGTTWMSTGVSARTRCSS